MNTTIKELVDFIEQLENPLVILHDNSPNPHKVFRKINLKILTKNIESYDNLTDWIKSKNMTDHLKKNVILTFLDLNPPENIKNELISLML